MGREVKRVPLQFDWPIGTTWWGYLYGWKMSKRLEELGDVAFRCGTCSGSGRVQWRTADYQTPEDGTFYCPHCEGEKTPYFPSIEPPKGDAWQMWETTSEGSPISPPFATPEELARWLADTGASSFGDCGATYEQWLRMVKKGWAPSAVSENGQMMSGVEFVAGQEAEA